MSVGLGRGRCQRLRRARTEECTGQPSVGPGKRSRSMKLRFATVITLAMGVAAIVLPVGLSIAYAERQALEAETQKVRRYALDVLARSELTAAQLRDGFVALSKKSRGQDPCSAAIVSAMRVQDLASSNIEVFGYISGDRLVCSSLGADAEPVLLGPVEKVTSSGMGIRSEMSFPFLKQGEFTVYERDGLVAIVRRGILINATTYEPDVSLSVFSADRVVSSKGPVKPEWIAMAGEDVTLIDASHIVVVVRSRQYDMGAVAALPIAHARQNTEQMGRTLLPLGVLGGLTLGGAFLHLARRQQALPAMIKEGLRSKEFFLMYQPIVDLRSGDWVGAEVLIRWSRPGGDVVRPDIFIPAAEDARLIRRITAYVLQRVAREASQLFRHHPAFHLGINLSAADLRTLRTVDQVRQLRQHLQAAPANLVLEVTERGLVDKDRGREVLNALRAEGVQIAIDDFGTGYSCLSYLETFNLDFLKIDKSFVDTVGSAAATRHVVQHIIEMAKSLQLKMIAEGVETEEQAQYLRMHGVQFAQGWLFSKPMRYAELMEQLSLRAALRTDQPELGSSEFAHAA